MGGRHELGVARPGSPNQPQPGSRSRDSSATAASVGGACAGGPVHARRATTSAPRRRRKSRPRPAPARSVGRQLGRQPGPARCARRRASGQSGVLWGVLGGAACRRSAAAARRKASGDSGQARRKPRSAFHRQQARAGASTR
jgi:hypothetical protein